MNIFLDLPKHAIIAHRGASGQAPENTLPAFRLAVEQGADAIELDAMLTRDGEVVVTHDLDLGPTKAEKGTVRKMSFADISAIDAGAWFSPEFTGTQIPTLRQVLQEIAPHILINIELKNDASLFDSVAEQVAKLIRETGTAERIFISSFNPIALMRFHWKIPDVPIGLLSQGDGIRLRRFISGWVSYEAVHPVAASVTAPLIQNAQAQGLRVYSYTVNDAEMMRDFFEWGIDGIFTDHPALAIKIRSEVLANETQG